MQCLSASLGLCSIIHSVVSGQEKAIGFVLGGGPHVNLLADESVDRHIVDRLRQDGHELRYVFEMEPGISDDAVLGLAQQESALLLTADKDFGELVFRQRRVTTGFVLLRLAGLSAENKVKVVVSAINKNTAELPQAFAVITPDAIRIRRRGVQDTAA